VTANLSKAKQEVESPPLPRMRDHNSWTQSTKRNWVQRSMLTLSDPNLIQRYWVICKFTVDNAQNGSEATQEFRAFEEEPATLRGFDPQRSPSWNESDRRSKGGLGRREWRWWLVSTMSSQGSSSVKSNNGSYIGNRKPASHSHHKNG
jgi:hypothetical protein